MPEDSAQHFYRVKRGRMLRDPRTGATLGTPGQLVPQEHRDLDPGVCLGPVELEVGTSPEVPTDLLEVEDDRGPDEVELED